MAFFDDLKKFAAWNPLGIDKLASSVASAVPEGVKQFAVGQPGRVEQLQNFTPEQQKILNELGPLAFGGIKEGMTSSFPQLPGVPSFEPIKQQAIEQYRTQTQPMIAERLTQFGARPSDSAFLGSIAGGERGLARDLAALQSEYGLKTYGLETQRAAAQHQQQYDKQRLLQQLLGLGLGQQFTHYPVGSQPGALQQAAPALSQFLTLMALGLI